jgi:hypothetical protein
VIKSNAFHIKIIQEILCFINFFWGKITKSNHAKPNPLKHRPFR